MVQNIVDVIEEKCEEGRYPEDFRQRIHKKTNFVDAYNEIEQYTNEKQNFWIPDRIPTNTNLTLNKNSANTGYNAVNTNYNAVNTYNTGNTGFNTGTINQTNTIGQTGITIEPQNQVESLQYLRTANTALHAPISTAESAYLPHSEFRQVYNRPVLQPLQPLEQRDTLINNMAFRNSYGDNTNILLKNTQTVNSPPVYTYAPISSPPYYEPPSTPIKFNYTPTGRFGGSPAGTGFGGFQKY